MTGEFSDKSNARSPSVAGLSVPREGLAPAESDPTRLMVSNESNTQDSTEQRAHPTDEGVEILTGSDEDGEEIIVAGDEGVILTDGGEPAEHPLPPLLDVVLNHEPVEASAGCWVVRLEDGLVEIGVGEVPHDGEHEIVDVVARFAPDREGTGPVEDGGR